MSYLSEIIGASAIAGYTILVVILLNARESETSPEILLNTATQRQTALTTQILEYYFLKAGYNAEEENIINADSNRFKFNCDLNDSGRVISCDFFKGNTSDLSNTENPNDAPLYLIEDNSDYRQTIGAVSELKFAYLDSMGVLMSYDSLKFAAWREKIKGIKISVIFESPERFDSVYQTVIWQRTILPRNIH